MNKNISYSTNIQNDKYRKILYVFLFAAVFNDILRVGSTNITLFRVMLPVISVLIFYFEPRVRKLFFLFCVLSILSLIQSLFFCSFNSVGVKFSLLRFLTYLFFYACITIVIGSVIALYEADRAHFARAMGRFILISGFLYLVVFISKYHFRQVKEFFYFNNDNDYASMIAMIIPFIWYVYKRTNRVVLLLFIPVGMIYMRANDCKLSLLGASFAVFLIVWMELRNRVQNRKIRWAVFATIILSVIFVIRILPKERLQPLYVLIKGDLYHRSSSSLVFRVNSMVLSIKWILKTRFAGIGIGNAGVLMKKLLEGHVLPDIWVGNERVSLHNSILEWLLEFGFVAVVGLAAFIGKLIMAFSHDKMSDEEICLVSSAISGTLWLAAPSEVLTDYLIFVVFGYLIICINRNNMSPKEQQGR